MKLCLTFQDSTTSVCAVAGRLIVGVPRGARKILLHMGTLFNDFFCEVNGIYE